jgi:hypothetical protein
MLGRAGGPVEEPEFWRRLEYRICTEFRGSKDDHLRWYWCDGLVPQRYDRHAGDRDAIDWAGLLPSDELTGWLTADPVSKILKIADFEIAQDVPAA